MRTALLFILGAVAALPTRCDPVNADSLVIQDFTKRVFEYVQLRKTEESKLPRLRATPSRKRITDHQLQLGQAMVDARKSAAQGDIFSPAIEKLFRHLLGLAMQPGDAPRIRKSLRNAEPVAAQPLVNHPYPRGKPLQSTPPSILLNLPQLPDDIEYRFVNRTLILLDAKANLVIDFIANVGP